MKGHPIRWTPEQLAWIEAHATLPRRETHAAFVARFGRADVSADALKSLCWRRGWGTGRDGRFAPGAAPVNKGKRMPFHPASAATRFKPGQLSGRAAKVRQPIGAERLSKCGYRERKINDAMPFQRRWRAVHLIRWEAAHGPLPAGWCLKSLDGDRLNTDPANWVAIPRALLPRLNGRFGRDYDSAPPEMKPLILRTALLEHAARDAGRR